MAKIKQLKAIEILNSRGEPTVETIAILSDNSIGVASCPKGASVGTYEALDLIDNDLARLQGKGVKKAVDNVNNIIAPKLIDLDACNQALIDKTMIELDKTQNKSNLGANAILSVSMAICKASAKSSSLPLFLYLCQFIKNGALPLRIPTPCFNIINGGKHADDGIDFQEFMVIPASSKSYTDSLEMGVTIYYALKKILKEKNLSNLIGDEGGFAPTTTNKNALSYLVEAVHASGLKLGLDVFFGIDAAANSFFQNKQYLLKEKGQSLSTNDLISYYEEINKNYNLLYLEDALTEDDFQGWADLSSRLSKNTIIIGDDLTVTNPYRLQIAISKNLITGIIIKPNQIGTVIEALAVVEMAREAGLKIIVSHRSGETNDDFIADFAVAVSADYVKFGAPARGERVAKYNRLLHIEKQLKTI